VLEAAAIEPGSDLRAILDAAAERLIAEGWVIEERGRLAWFFYHRDGVRRFVTQSPRSPELPLYGPSWHPACPGCGE
jgi:hypothetical protein